MTVELDEGRVPVRVRDAEEVELLPDGPVGVEPAVGGATAGGPAGACGAGCVGAAAVGAAAVGAVAVGAAVVGAVAVPCAAGPVVAPIVASRDRALGACSAAQRIAYDDATIWLDDVKSRLPPVRA